MTDPMVLRSVSLCEKPSYECCFCLHWEGSVDTKLFSPAFESLRHLFPRLVHDHIGAARADFLPARDNTEASLW